MDDASDNASIITERTMSTTPRILIKDADAAMEAMRLLDLMIYRMTAGQGQGAEALADNLDLLASVLPSNITKISEEKFREETCNDAPTIPEGRPKFQQAYRITFHSLQKIHADCCCIGVFLDRDQKTKMNLLQKELQALLRPVPKSGASRSKTTERHGLSAQLWTRRFRFGDQSAWEIADIFLSLQDELGRMLPLTGILNNPDFAPVVEDALGALCLELGSSNGGRGALIAEKLDEWQVHMPTVIRKIHAPNEQPMISSCSELWTFWSIKLPDSCGQWIHLAFDSREPMVDWRHCVHNRTYMDLSKELGTDCLPEEFALRRGEKIKALLLDAITNWKSYIQRDSSGKIPTLSDTEVKVLRTIQIAQKQLNGKILAGEAQLRLVCASCAKRDDLASLGTVKKHRPTLKVKGLIVYPAGKKSGCQITALGHRVLASIGTSKG